LKNKLFKSAAIYTVPNFLSAGLSVFFLPILTRYLEPSDYGVLANFNALLAVLTILIGFSSQGAITVNYFHLSKEKISEYIANVFLLLICSTFLSACVLFLSYRLFLASLGFSLFWAVAAVFIAACNFVTFINLSLWQAEQNPRPYAILQVSSIVLNVILSLIFVVLLSLSWQGRIIGSGFAVVIFAAVSMILIHRRGFITPRFNPEYIKDALSFGLPLIPHQLSFWLRTGFDRFILTLVVSTAATGLYNVSFQVASAIWLLLTAFNQAWAPFLFKKLIGIDESQKRTLVKYTYVYFVVVLFIALAASVLLPLVLPFLIGENFRGASSFLGYLCFGFAFQGMYLMVANYLFFVKKTRALSLVTFSCGVIHVLLCFLLVQSNGAVGAAQAFLLSSFLTFVGVWRLAARYYQMPWLLTRGV
jgi:O-antigen/teichoic acid export membrane protein